MRGRLRKSKGGPLSSFARTQRTFSSQIFLVMVVSTDSRHRDRVALGSWFMRSWLACPKAAFRPLVSNSPASQVQHLRCRLQEYAQRPEFPTAAERDLILMQQRYPVVVDDSQVLGLERWSTRKSPPTRPTEAWFICLMFPAAASDARDSILFVRRGRLAGASHS